jgi:FkbM family methyltransferase
MVLFDIGANRGDATIAGLQQGYKVIACEPAPRIYAELVKNFIYNPNVIPLKIAASDSVGTIEFYEAEEDGLSSLNKDWLTDESLPYHDKPFRTVKVNTTTIDLLAEKYGEPDLMKIDVEGAEWSVFKGMTKYHGKLAFEWTDVTLDEHQAQLEYLAGLGYKEVGPQFITNHLEEPKKWYPLKGFNFSEWVANNSSAWINEEWKAAGLRPTADVGMCWVS